MTPLPRFEAQMCAKAQASVEFMAASGAARLLLEPWRIGRLIHRAEALEGKALARIAARRQRAAKRNLLADSLAHAQLALAVGDKNFPKLWFRWRLQRRLSEAMSEGNGLTKR